MNFPVEIQFYLVIGQRVKNDRTEGRPTVRAAKLKPACAPHEVPIFISMKLPFSVFRRPALKATIEVPGDSMPPVIDSAVQHNITELIREQLGIHLTISAPEPDGV